jgi:hypothetical protein
MNNLENPIESGLEPPTSSESATDPVIEEHPEDAIDQELTHKGLLVPPHPPDHDLRHDLPLHPSDQFDPDPHPPTRDVL